MSPLQSLALDRARDALALAANASTAPDPFSLSNLIRAHVTDTWNKRGTYERSISDALNAEHGIPERNGIRLPDNILQRDLTVATTTAGGFLVGATNLGYIPSLAAESVALKAGAQVVNFTGGGVAMPTANGLATTTWLANEAATITESQPVFGQVVGTPKLLSCFVEVSRQLLLQSNAEAVLKAELRRAAAVALDTAVIAGTGASGQPTGITVLAGTGAFTGASLTAAACRNAESDLATANAGFDLGTLAFVAPPATAETLASRQRFTGASTTLWDGPLQDGAINGVRAIASTTVPASTLILAAWSSVYIVQWSGGLVIELDPYTKFQSGIVGVRLLFPVDVVPTRATAISIATGVT